MPSAPDPVPQPLDHLAERGRGEAPALVLRGETLSWNDLRVRVGRFAAWLAARVPEQGARVASWAGKGELTCLLPLAAARAGLVHVPINPLLKRAQAAHILADSGSSLLMATHARLTTLERGDVPDGCEVAAEDATMEMLASTSHSLPPSSIDPGALAALLYTSGSTGRPKGVMLSHANLWLGAVGVADYLGLAEDDVTLAVLPLSFDYGQSQLLSTWHAGGCVVPLDYLAPRDVIKACGRYGVTTLAGVPSLWLQLVEQDWPRDAVTPMRRLTNSGGALTVDLVRKMRSIFRKQTFFRCTD
jgi:acyl-CoA synthetase (AMP-forming)/AMP-acid ligase II